MLYRIAKRGADKLLSRVMDVARSYKLDSEAFIIQLRFPDESGWTRWRVILDKHEATDLYHTLGRYLELESGEARK